MAIHFWVEIHTPQDGLQLATYLLEGWRITAQARTNRDPMVAVTPPEGEKKAKGGSHAPHKQA